MCACRRALDYGPDVAEADTPLGPSHAGRMVVEEVEEEEEETVVMTGSGEGGEEASSSTVVSSSKVHKHCIGHLVSRLLR